MGKRGSKVEEVRGKVDAKVRRMKLYVKLKARVNEVTHSLRCLVDTGNSVMSDVVINAATAKRLGLTVKRLFDRQVGTAKAETALKVVGESSEFKIRLNNMQQIYNVKALVVENLAQEINIGSFFLSRNQILLNFHSNGTELSTRSGEKTELVQSINPSSSTSSTQQDLSGQYSVYQCNKDSDFPPKDSDFSLFSDTFSISEKKFENFEQKFVNFDKIENANATPEQKLNFDDANVANDDANCSQVKFKDQGSVGVGKGKIDVNDGATKGGGSQPRDQGEGTIEVLQEGPSVCLRLSESVNVKSQAINVIRVNIPKTKDRDILIQCPNLGERGEYEERSRVCPGVYRAQEDEQGNMYVLALMTNQDDQDVTLPKGAMMGMASQLKTTKVKASEVMKGERLEVVDEGEYVGIDGGSNVEDSDPDFANLLKDLRVNENKLLKANRKAKRKLIRILKRYQDCFKITGGKCKYGKTKLTKMKIRLKPGAVPVRAKVRNLNPKQQETLQKQIDEWLEYDIIRPSTSEWASGCVIVGKKTGDERVCIDYRKLNDATEGDAYPIPNIQALLAKAGGHRVYSALDASNAYHNIEMEEESRHLTAFISPSGLYEFNRLPFGLKGAGAAYSRFIDMAMSRLGTKHFNTYLDDILAYSQDINSHLDRLEEVFQVHREAGIRINAKKTTLLVEEVDYLGHQLSAKGVTMIPSYVEKILNWPEPKTVKELNTLLGFLSYYRSFIPEFSELTAEMMEQKRRKKLSWTEEMTKSLDKLKEKFKSAPIRAVPDFESKEKFILTTDFSGRALSAILSQVQDGQERLICAGGRKATDPETRYASWKGELSAMMYGFRKFESILRYKPFLVVTDSTCLKYLQTMANPKGIAGRWLDEVQNYDFTVVHRPGRQNKNADSLSRANHLPEPEPYEEQEQKEYICTLTRMDLRAAQSQDPVLKEVERWLGQGQPPTKEEMKGKARELHQYRGIFEALKKLEDGLLVYTQSVNDYQERKVERVLVPEECRSEVFHHSHSHPTAGHFGMDATVERAKIRFFYPGMNMDLRSQVQNCPNCLMKKTKESNRVGQHVPRNKSYPGETVFIDLIGPYPETTEGYKYCLTVEDGFTRFAQVYPLKSKEAIEVTKELTNKYISTWGCPAGIHSDNGKEFTNKIFANLMKELQIVKTNTPIYNPWSNRVERFHKTLNTALRTVLGRQDTAWLGFLPAITLAYNTKKHATTGVSPYLATFGREANLPVDLVIDLPRSDRRTMEEQVRDSLQRFRRIYAYMLKNEKAVIERNSSNYVKEGQRVKEGDLCWYLTPRLVPGKPAKFTAHWTGPWVVLQQVAPVLVKVKPQNNEGKPITVHFSRLRPYHGPPTGTVPNHLALAGEDEDEDNSNITLHQSAAKPSITIPIYTPVATVPIQDKPNAAEDGVAEQPGEPDPGVGQQVQDEVVTEGNIETEPNTNEETMVEESEPTKPSTNVKTTEMEVEPQRGVIRKSRELSATTSDAETDARPALSKKPRPRRTRAKVSKLLSSSSSDEAIDAIIPVGVGSCVPSVSPIHGKFKIGLAESNKFQPGVWQRLDLNFALGLVAGQAAQLTASSQLSNKGIIVNSITILPGDTDRLKCWFYNTKQHAVEVKEGVAVLEGIILTTNNDVKFKETGNLHYD